MSRKPAMTSLLNGQAVKSSALFDQRHLEFRLELLQCPRAAGAAKAAADHHDARPGFCERRRGEGNDAADAATPRTTSLRVIKHSASMIVFR